MANIVETLTLVDNYSAGFSNYIAQAARGASATAAAQGSLDQMASAAAAAAHGLDMTAAAQQGASVSAAESAAAMDRTAAAAAGLEDDLSGVQRAQQQLSAAQLGASASAAATTAAMDRTAAAADGLEDNLKDVQRAQQQTARGATGLTGSLRQMLSVFGLLQAVQWLAGTSDEMSQIEARLVNITGSTEAASAASRALFDVAARTRGAYADTAAFAAQIGTMAGEAFGGDFSQVIAFTEQLNKQMVVSGTGTAQRSAAMLQLTQALSSGVLRGEELNSILENTPLIAQNIARYMGVSVGEMRNLAAEGMVTAEIVKNAMFAAADETNAAFESMPLTWSQVWAGASNIVIRAAQPVLAVINAAANSMDTIGPIAIGAAAGVGVYAAATAAATVAQQGLNLAMLSNPVTWIAAAIGVGIAAVAAWAMSVGDLELAWAIGTDFILTQLEKLQFGAVNVAGGIQIAFNTMKGMVMLMVQGMVNGVIDALNLIPGADFDRATFGDDAAAEAAAKNQAIQASIADYGENLARRQELRSMEILEIRQRVEEAATTEGISYTPYTELAGIGSSLSGIGADVAGIRREVSMSQEDLKALVDIAERRYINNINLNAPAPQISISGQNTGSTEADRVRLAAVLRDMILDMRGTTPAVPAAQ